MGTPPQSARSVGRPRRFNREHVLDVALAIVDDRGLDALSIRSLALALGVTPGTVYSYATSKDDLLCGLADRVVATIPVRDGEPYPSWSGELHALMCSYYRLLTAHPNLLSPGLIIRGAVPAGARVVERALFLVERAGADSAGSFRAVSALTSYVYGSAHNAVWSREVLALGAFDRELYDPSEFPRLRAANEQFAPDEIEAAFEDGLDRLIGSLDARSPVGKS